LRDKRRSKKDFTVVTRVRINSDAVMSKNIVISCNWSWVKTYVLDVRLDQSTGDDSFR